MLTPPLWLDPLPQPRPALRGPLAVDVVVLGAGLCGASAALHLVQEGLRVAVVESRAGAMAASGRNAGFILQGTAERYSRARALMGHERARRVHAWSVENHVRMAEAITKLGISCEYQRRGSLQIGAGAEEEAELLESARMMVEDGFEAEVRQGEALHERYRSRGNTVALFLPGDGEVHPARLVRGLLDAAERGGALIFEGCPATALDASTARRRARDHPGGGDHRRGRRRRAQRPGERPPALLPRQGRPGARADVGHGAPAAAL
ncbi:MAG: FAD-binding oxidoreductase [Deltaproteobacteria bacterium]|nr:FAD-binding oxidoreductase [Deltaproteobacteria bacterium]